MATATKAKCKQTSTSTPTTSSSSQMPTTEEKHPASKAPHHTDAKTQSQSRNRSKDTPKTSFKTRYSDYGLIMGSLISVSLQLLLGGNLKTSKQTDSEANKGAKK